jgi:hypothetical protein
MKQQEDLRPDYQRYATGLAEAVELQQAASREAIHWQAVRDRANDKHARQYFEGLAELSRLKAFHHNLVAQSLQQAGHGESDASFNSEAEDKTQPPVPEPASRAESSVEIDLARKGRDRVKTEHESHLVKAAALALLGERSRELGMEERAASYEYRGRRENATARGFQVVIKAYERRLEILGGRTSSREESPGLQNGFRRLARAERFLEEYNSAQASVMDHLRQLDGAVGQRDEHLKSAEKEALDAVTAYREFQKETQIVREAHRVLSPTTKDNQLESTVASHKSDLDIAERSQTLHESEGDLEGPGRTVTEKKISDTTIKEPAPHKPELQPDKSDITRPTASEQRRHRVAVAVVAGQILKEMDREM